MPELNPVMEKVQQAFSLAGAVIFPVFSVMLETEDEIVMARVPANTKEHAIHLVKTKFGISNVERSLAEVVDTIKSIPSKRSAA